MQWVARGILKLTTCLFCIEIKKNIGEKIFRRYFIQKSKSFYPCSPYRSASRLHSDLLGCKITSKNVKKGSKVLNLRYLSHSMSEEEENH